MHPVVVGEGLRLTDGGGSERRLVLVDGQTTPAGNAILTYAPR